MEDEINLADYIKTILKHKALIFFTVILAVALGGIIVWQSAETYRAETILEVGQIEIGQKEFVPDPPNQLVEKIKNKNYNEAVKAKLNLKGDFKIKAENPKDTELVIINVISPGQDEAKKILKEVENIILKEHQDKFDAQINILLDSQKRTENKISFMENEKKIAEEKISYLAELLSRESSASNQILLTEAKERLEVKKSEIEREYLNLNSLCQKIESSESTNAIKAISITKAGVNANIILFSAGILGLFVGFLLAFFMDFLEKNKNKLQ